MCQNHRIPKHWGEYVVDPMRPRSPWEFPCGTRCVSAQEKMSSQPIFLNACQSVTVNAMTTKQFLIKNFVVVENTSQSVSVQAKQRVRGEANFGLPPWSSANRPLARRKNQNWSLKRAETKWARYKSYLSFHSTRKKFGSIFPPHKMYNFSPW